MIHPRKGSAHSSEWELKVFSIFLAQAFKCLWNVSSCRIHSLKHTCSYLVLRTITPSPYFLNSVLSLRCVYFNLVFSWKKWAQVLAGLMPFMPQSYRKNPKPTRTYDLSKGPYTVTSHKHQRGEWWFLFPRLWIWFWTIPCWVRTIYSFSFSVLLEDRHDPHQMMPNSLLVSLHFSISNIAARPADVKGVHAER